MGGRMVTNDVSMEICAINTCAAATADHITSPSTTRGVVVLVIDVGISGRSLVLFHRRSR